MLIRDPQLQSLLARERAVQLRADSAPGDPIRRRVGLRLVAIGLRLAEPHATAARLRDGIA